MDRVNGGPCVDQRMQPELPGIFACGNVLHVHDLVDYVSQEAALAGKEAALWAQGGCGDQDAPIALRAGKGIRYTVPQRLCGEAEGSVTVRFRVDNVYENSSVAVYCGAR